MLSLVIGAGLILDRVTSVALPREASDDDASSASDSEPDEHVSELLLSRLNVSS